MFRFNLYPTIQHLALQSSTQHFPCMPYTWECTLPTPCGQIVMTDPLPSLKSPPVGEGERGKAKLELHADMPTPQLDSHTPVCLHNHRRVCVCARQRVFARVYACASPCVLACVRFECACVCARASVCVFVQVCVWGVCVHASERMRLRVCAFASARAFSCYA